MILRLMVICSFLISLSWGQEAPSFFDKKRSASLGLGPFKNAPYDRDYLNSSDKDKEERLSFPALNVSYNIFIPWKADRFLNISPNFYYQFSKGFKERDKDIQDANSTAVRLVSNLEDLSSFELGCDFLVGKLFSFGKFTIAPSVGLGVSFGTEDLEQEWVTDRAVPLPFSSHNHYDLSSKRNFYAVSLLAQVLLNVKRWDFFIRYRFSKLNTIGNIKQKFDLNGDEEFVSSARNFEYADHQSSNSNLLLGVGYRF